MGRPLPPLRRPLRKSIRHGVSIGSGPLARSLPTPRSLLLSLSLSVSLTLSLAAVCLSVSLAPVPEDRVCSENLSGRLSKVVFLVSPEGGLCFWRLHTRGQVFPLPFLLLVLVLCTIANAIAMTRISLRGKARISSTVRMTVGRNCYRANTGRRYGT